MALLLPAATCAISGVATGNQPGYQGNYSDLWARDCCHALPAWVELRGSVLVVSYRSCAVIESVLNVQLGIRVRYHSRVASRLVGFYER